AGVLSGGYRHRMYMSFDTSSIANAKIGSAFLGFYVTGSECIDEAMTLGLTSPGWSVNNLTWNSQPATFTTYDNTHYYGGNQSGGSTACPTSAKIGRAHV